MDPVIQISVAYALAVLWLFGGVHKVMRFRRFSATVREYHLLPDSLSAPSAAIVAALVGLLPAQPRALVWVDAISIGATVCVLAAFYAAANGLIFNARELNRLGH